MPKYSLAKQSDTHFMVVKDGINTYDLLFKQSRWSCSCPARKTCKHIAMLPAEVQVRRYPRASIKMAYDSIEPYLFPYRHTIVGSYRRGLPDSKDIDIIVLCDERTFNILRMQICGCDDFTFISGGDKKFHGTLQGIPCDIDCVTDPLCYAAHLLYRTGPASLNIKMRQLAKERGFTLNEHVEAADEGQIFDMVGMNYTSPENRK